MVTRQDFGIPRRNLTQAQDIWTASRTGQLSDVESAVCASKKCGTSIDAKNGVGVSALHIAVCRNHMPIIRCLLNAGADPDLRDGESGWSSLHRALHFGHLAAAAALIRAGASLSIEDTKGRSPLDLISGDLAEVVAGAGATEAYSWGNGANYQLGTGMAGIQQIPCRVDSLQGLDPAAVAAARFHSAAITANGEMLTWGFGRGGRLGHPDFDIHSGQVAVILPRPVSINMSQLRVRVVAAAKHHTVAATESGDVYTWGSNREGRLGYNAVDSQAVPRRVTALRVRVTAVAAANKHTAVLTDAGEAFTWGCNLQGQLGYGTSNSQANSVPRVVDHLKGTPLTTIAAAKHHTVVLTCQGEAYSWGQRMVTPRRVQVVRDTRKGAHTVLRFHRKERLQLCAVAAGACHTTVLSRDGLVFYWASNDASLRCHQVTTLSGWKAVAVAAGKYRTAVITAAGDVFAWDANKTEPEQRPMPERIWGLKHVCAIAVGESHSLALLKLHVPQYPAQPLPSLPPLPAGSEDVYESRLPVGLPTLKALCQSVLGTQIAEPRNAVQLMEAADALEAPLLKAHCQVLIMRNLDYILTVAPGQIASCPQPLLAELENILSSCSQQAWSCQRLPTPSSLCGSPELAARHVVALSDQRRNHDAPVTLLQEGHGRSTNAIAKHLRTVRKKLQQIDTLEQQQRRGKVLGPQQIEKLNSKEELLAAAALLESGVLPPLLSSPSCGSESHGKKGQSNLLIDESISNERNNLAAGGLEKKNTRTKDAPQSVEGVANLDCTEQQCGSFVASSESSKELEQGPSSGVDAPLELVPPQMVEPGFQGTSSPAPGHVAKNNKKKVKKGGLSMFLSGALEETVREDSPPAARVERPAWGGTSLATAAKRTTSLRDIQKQQDWQAPVETGTGQKSSPRDCGASMHAPSDGRSRFPLAQFVRGSPTPGSTSLEEAAKSPPPWVASPSERSKAPSLRKIQLQQKSAQSSPAGSTAGQARQLASSPVVQSASVSTTSSEADVISHWYKPEAATQHASLRCIQIEEKAMQELQRRYGGSVRIKSQE